MTRPPIPLPSTLSWWYLQARAHRPLIHGPDAVAWRARCPHGAEGEWHAIREDTRSEVTVQCDCEEAA